jgi:hypothetical protein
MRLVSSCPPRLGSVGATGSGKLAGLTSTDGRTASNIHDRLDKEMSRGPTMKRQGNPIAGNENIGVQTVGRVRSQ